MEITMIRTSRAIGALAIATLSLAGVAGTVSASTAPSTPVASGAAMAGPTGPLCAAVPADGEGSVSGMADDPVGTAASNNPLLSTLVAAVTAANLGDTLNSAGPFTVFAPVNSAFDKIPTDTLQSVLGDVPTLTSVLTYHVLRSSSAAPTSWPAGRSPRSTVPT